MFWGVLLLLHQVSTVEPVKCDPDPFLVCLFYSSRLICWHKQDMYTPAKTQHMNKIRIFLCSSNTSGCQEMLRSVP